MGPHVCVQFLVSASQGKGLRERSQPWSSGPVPLGTSPSPSHRAPDWKAQKEESVHPPTLSCAVESLGSVVGALRSLACLCAGSRDKECRWKAEVARLLKALSLLSFPQIPLGCIYKGEGVSRMKSSSEVISNLKLIKYLWIHSLPLESNCVQDVML